MAQLFSIDDLLDYMKTYFNHNKARGMVAEVAFEKSLSQLSSTVSNKYFDGAWVVAPKAPNALQHRCAIFVLPDLADNFAELNAQIKQIEADRGQQALFTFLNQNGIGVVVAGAIVGSSVTPFDLQWTNFVYKKEQLIIQDDDLPFSKWPRGRGRANKNKKVWDVHVLERYQRVDPTALTALTLRQAYYYGYFKNRLKIPFSDPYDVDGFLVSYTGHVLPVEIKEKSVTKNGEFGIDAGRVLMMLRLCLTTDKNALYIVREVDESEQRQFIEWRCITLSDIVMGASWNLQAGGRGMGGGSTQTIMLSGALFNSFTQENMSEDWFDQNASLHKSVKVRAELFATKMEAYL